MSIVAPIAAAGMALPVVVGIAGGDRPGPVRLAGMVVAGAGVILASREGAPPGAAARAARTSVDPRAAGGARVRRVRARPARKRASGRPVGAARRARRVPASADAVLGLGARIGAPPRPRLLHLGPIALVGLLDVSANGLYALATRHGLLSVVAVGSSLYPLVTVLLARALLGERVRRSQEAGRPGCACRHRAHCRRVTELRRRSPGAVPSRGGLDQRGEQRRMPVVAGQALRVPLHADRELAVGGLDSLDCAVRRGRS